MKETISLSLIFVLYTFAASATTLHFAGDSTLDDHGYSRGGRIHAPYYSWGTQLQKSMKSDCRVLNYARSGDSTKSFAAAGRWKTLIDGVRPGDFVAIQFGHNDQKRSTEFYREKRWADPKGLFREIVRGWVKDVRDKGASPILLSPICRATFDKEGKRLVDEAHRSDGVCLRSYRDAMHELSEEQDCDFVDMNTLTRDLMERLGREASHKFFVVSTKVVRGKDGESAQDVTHPIQTGAAAFAKLFLDDVRARGLSVAKLFKTAEFPITDFGAASDGAKCTDDRGMADGERALVRGDFRIRRGRLARAGDAVAGLPSEVGRPAASGRLPAQAPCRELVSDQGEPARLGRVRLGDVRLRQRQPARGREGRDQRQGACRLRPQDAQARLRVLPSRVDEEAVSFTSAGGRLRAACLHIMF